MQNPCVQGRAYRRACQPPCPHPLPEHLQPGDTLIVWKLDRLGRSLRDLIHMLDDFKRQGIKFKSLTEAIDTETPTGRAMWQMIGVLAELERSLITHPRWREGGAAPGGEIRAQGETHTRPAGPCAQAD
jgi:DNA invertase Pin-like site-specific DNA recombinase